MKKILFFIIIVIPISTQLLNASCITDEKTWSEKIFKGDYFSAVFTCKALEFSAERNSYGELIYTTGGIYGLKAVVQIDKVFFGKIDTIIVNLNAGFYMETGETYLIYAYGKGNNFSFDGYCDIQSKKIISSKNVIRELEILSEISDIINNKLTCNYVISDSENNKLAEGFYKNGKPVKIWRHYYNNGGIKAEYDFTNHSVTQYYNNGSKNYKNSISGNKNVYYKFSTKNNNFLEYKTMSRKKNYGNLTTWFWYYDNGNIKKQYSTKEITCYHSFFDGNGENHIVSGVTSDEKIMNYKEYYDNGNIKSKGEFFIKDSIGIWYLYDEDGKLIEKKTMEK